MMPVDFIIDVGNLLQMHYATPAAVTALAQQQQLRVRRASVASFARRASMRSSIVEGDAESDGAHAGVPEDASQLLQRGPSSSRVSRIAEEGMRGTDASSEEVGRTSVADDAAAGAAALAAASVTLDFEDLNWAARDLLSTRKRTASAVTPSSLGGHPRRHSVSSALLPRTGGSGARAVGSLAVSFEAASPGTLIGSTAPTLSDAPAVATGRSPASGSHSRAMPPIHPRPASGAKTAGRARDDREALVPREAGAALQGLRSSTTDRAARGSASWATVGAQVVLASSTGPTPTQPTRTAPLPVSSGSPSNQATRPPSSRSHSPYESALADHEYN